MPKLYAVAFLLRDNRGVESIHATLGSGSDSQSLVDELTRQWARKGYTVVAYDVAETPQYFLDLIRNDFKIKDRHATKRIPVRRLNS